MKADTIVVQGTIQLPGPASTLIESGMLQFLSGSAPTLTVNVATATSNIDSIPLDSTPVPSTSSTDDHEDHPRKPVLIALDGGGGEP